MQKGNPQQTGAKRLRSGRSKRTAPGNVSRTCGAPISPPRPSESSFLDPPGRLIQNKRPCIWMGEIEHSVDGTGEGIEGAPANPLPMQPIVLDEAQNGG